ncbi:MAG: M23 family metallopeptidase [Clostridia bacterium]|nr:M23 family metallopeptidase [Clostridia bacterium]MBR2407299.1 M23 family metallopeptidase [Clostridia bacterium]
MAESRRTPGRFSLLAVQSIVCGVILLLALLFRLIGGQSWEQLRTVLRQWMLDDGLATLLVQEEEAVGGKDIPLGEAVSVTAPPDGASFSPLAVPQVTVLPLEEGRVTSPFGYRTDPLSGGTGFHTGIDVAAPAGTPLRAVYSGTVTAAGWDTSYGYYVTVRTAALEILYAHCSVLLCSAGDLALAGESVAKVGSTGDSTGNHVHIELRCEGICYDPSPLIAEVWYA